MDDETKRCLAEVLYHFTEDERKHWEEAEKPDEHIYLCLKRVDEWLNRALDAHTTESNVLKLADVELDIRRQIVARGGKEIRLSRKEFSLLEYLMQNSGIALTRDMILRHVWDVNADPFTNTVDVHIRFLRRKLGAGSSALIRTVHGYGYKFAVE